MATRDKIQKVNRSRARNDLFHGGRSMFPKRQAVLVMPESLEKKKSEISFDKKR